MASRIVSADGHRIGWFKTPRVKSGKHLAFIRALPCIACLCAGVITDRSQAAHLRFSCAAVGKINPGMAGKADDTKCLPLCPRHHLFDQHGGSEREFWERLRVDPFAACDLIVEAFPDVDSAREMLVRRFRGA